MCDIGCAAQDTVKECTFQPVTTWRSLSRATTAAKERLEASTSINSNNSDAALTRCAKSVAAAQDPDIFGQHTDIF